MALPEQRHQRASRLGLAALTAALLAACGGGGSDEPVTLVQQGLGEGRAYALAAQSDSMAAAVLPDAEALPSSAEPHLARLQAAAPAASRLYIVQMKQAPVAVYSGGVAGYAATKPAKGKKFDSTAPAAVKYADYLAARHDAKIAALGARKAYSYRFVFNGFAAELSEAQVAKLAADPDVVTITKDSIAKLETVSTPAFLGINAPGGLWSTLSGNANGNPIRANGPNSGGAGEGVVVGIIDSGIWPENASFSDRDADGKLVFQQIPGWNGKCVPGEEFNASHCNQKLISAQYFTEGFGGAAAIKAQFPYEFVSARAADGHGVHTASTAAGNHDVPATVGGINLGLISGMAPRARLAIYKTCWGIAPEGGCPNSDNVAAIDQAVADGVDVINYSISGTRTNFRDPVEIAFLNAADAGVFVAASAGNSGPTASTVAHPSPWITTVAASTHDRFYAATITLGNGATYSGASLNGGIASTPMVLSDTAAAAGVAVGDAALCFPDSLDPAKVAGKIVVCDRGVNARVEKSAVVKAAGGVGMVLVNTASNTLNADLHTVPSIHLSHLDRPAIRAYVSAAGATGAISAGQVTNGLVTAPTMASFSSRGPLLAGNGDLLKPDITAPGVDILAAYSPVAANNNFEFLQGTSMSSPHIAGLAALMKQRFPTWSPMAIKSALMTTAYQTTRTGSTGLVFGNPFSFGAGHVDPNRALNPGLVFDSNYADWLGFLCGTQLPTSFCTNAGVPVLDPSDLNVPSVAIGDLAGTQTVTRTVTNVSGQRATFTVALSGMAGMSVATSPASFTLNPGATQKIAITVTNATAPLNAYTAGALVWTSDKGHSVRIPVVVRPVALAAPAAVTLAGGSASFDVKFGYNGPFTASVRGLVPATITAASVSQDPDQTFDPADPTGTTAFQVVVPAGTSYARFALFDADVGAGTDLDLFVYNSAGTLVASSTSGTSAEEANLSNPVPGTYTVYVHGWGVPAGTTPFKLHTWLLGQADAGNMTVAAPATATLGTTGTVTVTAAAGLPAGRWLGTVTFGGAAGMPAPTIVRFDK